MTRILLVCDDEVLLSTRAALLRCCGAEVNTSGSHGAVELQQEKSCELVVLCHSLPEPSLASLAGTIHLRWPETTILVVLPQCDKRWVDLVAPVDEAVSSDPHRLLARVSELLGVPQPGRPGNGNSQQPGRSGEAPARRPARTVPQTINRF